MHHFIDVFTLEEANEALEWHARKLAKRDGKDPDAMINGLALDPKRQIWTTYLPEAERFMIGLEAWFGRENIVAVHLHGNGKVVDDAIEIVDAPRPD